MKVRGEVLDNHGSKGSVQRPVSDNYEDNWDKIFRKEEKEERPILSPAQEMKINGFV